jgi:CheY-like chemotaxis protein
MTTGSPTNPLEVLLVEDNPADARLTEEILKDSDYTLKLSVVEDGEAAIAYLRREGEYATAPRPDLILLDLMLPKKSGQEVLAEMNEDAGLTTIPVMILTGTEAEQSLLWSYNIPPSRFCRKPVDLARFSTVVTQLDTLAERPIVMASPPVAGQEEAAGAGTSRRWWWPFGR